MITLYLSVYDAHNSNIHVELKKKGMSQGTLRGQSARKIISMMMNYKKQRARSMHGYDIQCIYCVFIIFIKDNNQIHHQLHACISKRT